MKDYQLSCLPVSLFSSISNGEISFRDWLQAAKKLGLDAVDVSMILIHEHTPTYLQNMCRIMAEEKMSIAMATTYPDFTNPDSMKRELELAFLKSDIAVCATLGIPYLRVLAGQAHPTTERAAGIAWASEMLKRAAEIAEIYHVTLVYEDHYKPGAWEYVDFSHPTDIFLAIYENLRGTGVKLNFDTGNITAYGDDSLAILKQVYPDVATIHLSDTKALGVFAPVVIGTGAAPNEDILQYLKQAGFSGLISIEEASNTGFEGIRRAVEFVRNKWEAAS